MAKMNLNPNLTGAAYKEEACLPSLAVSVLIATRNRAQLLEQTLGHLARQDFPMHHWEVIVVDNGSTDGTKRVLQQHTLGPLCLKVLEEPRPGKNRALNRALSELRGELVVFTDDDIHPNGSWLTSLVEAANRWPQHSVFAGPIMPKWPESAPLWLADEKFRYARLAFGRFTPRQTEGPMDDDPCGGNVAIRRALLATAQFSEDIGPDGGKYFAMGSETELLRRLARHGNRFVYVPSAGVQHVIRDEQMSVSWLARRAFRHGRGVVLANPQPAAKMMAGAPRWLWRETAEAAMQYGLALLSSPRVRCEYGMRLCRLLGNIYGHRTLAARAADGSFVKDRESAVRVPVPKSEARF